MSHADSAPFEDLLDDLSRIARAVDPVPDAVLAAARDAFLSRDLDRELAVLIADSRTAGSAFEPVRADPEPQGRWLLSFEGGGIQVDMELAEDRGRLRLIGQISGDSGQDHFLESAGGRQRLEVDPIGRFLINDVAHGPMRLRCQSSCGLPVTTVWVTI
jgi:hypothetical protein